MEKETQIRLAHQLAKKSFNTLGAFALSKGYSPEVGVCVPANHEAVYIDFAYYSLGTYGEDGHILYGNSQYFHIDSYATRSEALAAFNTWYGRVEEELQDLPDLRRK